MDFTGTIFSATNGTTQVQLTFESGKSVLTLALNPSTPTDFYDPFGHGKCTVVAETGIFANLQPNIDFDLLEGTSAENEYIRLSSGN